MERYQTFVPEASDFALSTLDETKAAADPFSSDYPTWSKRFHCFQAYIFALMSFTSSLEFCNNFAAYGIVLFIPYCLFSAFVAIPAVLVEVMLGRYVIGDVTRAWSMCPPAKGILWCLIGTTIISICYGNLCSLYLLKYFFSSFDKVLKWNSCDKSWAKINCYEVGQKANAILKCTQTHPEAFCRNLTWESSGMQFWRYEIRNSENVGNVLKSIACLFLSVSFTVVINYKGMQSMEKMQTFMSSLPIALGVVLIFPSFVLPQALFGIKKMFTFNWNMLIKGQIWIDAFEDIFTLLGLGRLSLSFVSSHGKFTDDVIIDVFVITCGSFILNIIMTFPLLSIMISNKYMNDKEDNEPIFKDFEDVFVTMSEALLQYPFPTAFWSIITYLHWFMLSNNAQAVLVLAVSETIAGMFHKMDKFRYFIGVFSILTFIFNIFLIFIPFDFSWFLNTAFITITFLCTITWQLFYGMEKFNNDFFFLMGYPLPIFFKCTWLTLLILPFTGLVLKMYYRIPDKPLSYIVYICVGIPVLIYVLTILFQIIFVYKKKFLKVFTADPNWGPDDPLLKKSRIIFDAGTVTTEFMYRQELYRKPLMKPPDFSDQNIVQII